MSIVHICFINIGDLCECPCTEHDYNSRRLTVKPGSYCYKFFQCARFEIKPGTYCWAPRNCEDRTLFNETQINGVFSGRCNHANMVQCEGTYILLNNNLYFIII